MIQISYPLQPMESTRKDEQMKLNVIFMMYFLFHVLDLFLYKAAMQIYEVFRLCINFF